MPAECVMGCAGLAGLEAGAQSETLTPNCRVRTDKFSNLVGTFCCKYHLDWVGFAVEQEQVCLEGLCCFTGKCPV